MNEILSSKNSNPFQWEDDSRDSQEGSSILQTSLDDKDDSSNSVQVGDQSPARCSQITDQSRERLVLRLRRIHDRYYTVEDIADTGYLNYSYIR